MGAALTLRPAALLVTAEDGAGLPRYVLPDQARAIINVADTTARRYLLETLWQSDGRRAAIEPSSGREVAAGS